MAKRKRRSVSTRVGASPGALIAPADALPTSIRAQRFDATRIETFENVTPDALVAISAGPGVTWIDVVGVGSITALERIRDLFKIPHLAMADVVNIPQRPRVEAHEEGLFVVLQTPRPGGVVDLDQFSFFAGERIVLTVREHEDGVFDPLRARLQDPRSRIRGRGADYLLFRLVDLAVDAYFPHIDRLADSLDALENVVIAKPGTRPLQQLYSIRRDLGTLMRAALPSRDVLSSCARKEPGFFTADSLAHMRDVLDHAAQIVELVEHHRQAALDIQELALSGLDVRMNQVMKVLTAVTVIFIPLSFVTGLYGMNFDHMPELGWRYGYLIVLLGLLTLGGTIFWRLKRAGWLRFEEP